MNPTTEIDQMRDQLHCGCGWQVLRGLDCVLCGEEAAVLESRAAAVAEVLELYPV